jgi:hypothetical protein
MRASTSEQSQSNTTQAGFLAFYDEYRDVDDAVAAAVGQRKDLRARIKGAGFGLAAFDRARAEAEKSGERREAEDREYRRNMEWLGKPVGFQSTMGFPRAVQTGEAASSAANGKDHDAVSEHQRKQVEAGGFACGAAGHARESNPWTPGTVLYQTWDISWVSGAEELAQRQVGSDGKRRRPRGRPRGSRNRPPAGGANGGEAGADPPPAA